MKRARARLRGATAPQQAGARALIGVAFRIYLNGGALVLAVALFLVTGSVWSLATLVPWFLIAKIIRRMG